MKKIFLAIATVAAIVSCSNKSTTTTEKPDIIAANIDSTIRPGEDFFEYANGGWLKRNPIPDDQSEWGIGDLVIEENLKRLKEISEKAAEVNATRGSTDQKIGDFWTMAMDSVKIEADGLNPIQHLLDKINTITDIQSLVNTMADLKKIGSNTMFSDYVSQDSKKSDLMAYYLLQGGLGLPEREYYFKTDSATINIRNEYVKYITKILSMAGEDAPVAAAAAKNILALEIKLATASRKIEDLRDPYKNYNKMAITDLHKMAGNIDWIAYLKITGVQKIDSVVVGQPEFFKALNDALTQTPISDWKQYVKFNLVRDMSAVLPDAYGIEAFNFGKLFSGAKERKPRWKRAIGMEEDAMGEMLGQLYVKEFFNEKAKLRYTNMVEEIRLALKDRIGKLSWMGDSTKQKSYAKLASIKSKVGYPEKWKDFSSMEIGKESLAKNYMNSNLWWHNYYFSKLGKPVDRNEWDMYPQTYNAYYNSSNNEIILPAAIFTVPGYRDEELDDAVVYGYAASVIGHEITHGFDDRGRQFDEKGNLINWWTKTDEEAFNKRAAVMVEQFNEFEPVKGYHINGKASVGENIADLGGILLGAEAFKKTQQFKENKSISNLTPMQRYFMGYALFWLNQMREEQLKTKLLTNLHSPAKYRVNGPFADVDEFYTTFDIKPTDKMYRADSVRVRIW